VFVAVVVFFGYTCLGLGFLFFFVGSGWLFWLVARFGCECGFCRFVGGGCVSWAVLVWALNIFRFV